MDCHVESTFLNKSIYVVYNYEYNNNKHRMEVVNQIDSLLSLSRSYDQFFVFKFIFSFMTNKLPKKIILLKTITNYMTMSGFVRMQRYVWMFLNLQKCLTIREISENRNQSTNSAIISTQILLALITGTVNKIVLCDWIIMWPKMELCWI